MLRVHDWRLHRYVQVSFLDGLQQVLIRSSIKLKGNANMRFISFVIVLVLSISPLVAQTQPAPKTPADVKAPPTDAKKTPSGLAYKVIKAGTGKKHPAATDSVTVHYSGWTTDGKMFDSSVPDNMPATFPLNGVIAGWTEGVQLMVEGEKTRFWIPEKLAYQGRKPPFGMLVFDIELIKIR
jgi:FKBP-type peptidyl-prolyl cis-trans isomerase